MPGAGVRRAVLANLFIPGLDDRLAQHITPNPNPLAQQGGPAAPGAVDSLGNPVPSGPSPARMPGATSRPAAANRSRTPVNASYAADLLAATRQDRYAAGFNRDLEGMAAGFGTAQQQASKQAALAAAAAASAIRSATSPSIQGMQDQTIADNEHARFMGNAAIFAQTLSQSLGRPVSDQEATEIMNNQGLDGAVRGRCGGERDDDGHAEGRRGGDAGLGHSSSRSDGEGDRRLQGRT